MKVASEALLSNLHLPNGGMPFGKRRSVVILREKPLDSREFNLKKFLNKPAVFLSPLFIDKSWWP